MSQLNTQQLLAAHFRTPMLATIVVVVGALALGAGATTAQAGTDSFCSGSVAAGAVCIGPAHTLTASRGTNQDSGAGCGGAYLYGSYYCATPAGCHTYSATRILQPAIRHRSTTSKVMSGYSTWGSTGAPVNCVSDSIYSLVAGPLDDTSASALGVPVLARPAEQAPRPVAALVPGADAAEARRFTTPRGDAWVLVDPTSRELCLVADDAGTGYGVSCQGYRDARLIGSLSTFEDADAKTAAGDVVIALVPEGSEGLEIGGADGRTRTVAPEDGVVAISLESGDTTVTLDAADGADRAEQGLEVAVR